MPIEKADLFDLLQKICSNIPLSKSDIDSKYRLDTCFKYLIFLSLWKRGSQTELVTNPKEQLRILLPFLSPLMRAFATDLYHENALWRSVFTPSDEILLCYCYFNISIATQHIDQWKYETRVASFESGDPPWPMCLQLSAEKMAEYGFFRKEPRDKQHTACFVCGCTLSDWVATDTALDGHAQFRPQCPLVWILVFLKKALLTTYRDRYRDLYVDDDTREYQSLGSHSRLLTEQVYRRLQKFSCWCDLVELPSQELITKDLQSIVVARDVFQFKKMDILFTLCKKICRYWNAQKSLVTERDITIDVKNFYSCGAVLVKDILQNRRNSCNLPYIPGGMPPQSQFALPPLDGGLSLIDNIKALQNIPTSNPVDMSYSSLYVPQTSTNAGVHSVSTLNSERSGLMGIASVINRNLLSSDSRPVVSESGSESATAAPKLPPNVEKALLNRICVQCMRRSAVYLILPCRHLSLCTECVSEPKRITDCPACKQLVTEALRVYNS